MKKPLDRITEAYYGELGDAFSEKVRNRIHWVCENAKGETILDVGCSQGITSILLGREGKQVIGLDLLQEAIDFANSVLEKEEEVTRSLVEFRAANFMHSDFNNQQFDCIIFGEVLEHITDPNRFIKKAVSLLNTNGSIIITLPFGINDYFDHKKTYYMLDLLNFGNEDVVVQEIKFFGKWIGAVLKRKGEEHTSISINNELISRLEDAFNVLEKDLWQQIRTRGQKIKNYEEKIKTLSADNVKIKNLTAEQIQEKNNELELTKKQLVDKKRETEELIASFQSNLGLKDREKEETILSLQQQLVQKEKDMAEAIVSLEREKAEGQNNKEQDEKIKLLTNQLKQKEELIAKLQKSETEKKQQVKELETWLVITKKEKIQVQETLYQAYEKEEKLLQSYRKVLRRYNALSNSKLGKLTLSYWNKRRIKGGK